MINRSVSSTDGKYPHAYPVLLRVEIDVFRLSLPLCLLLRARIIPFSVTLLQRQNSTKNALRPELNKRCLVSAGMD